MTTKIVRPLLRFTVLILLAGAAAGCSTISDLDPTGLLSDDSSPTPSDQFPADASAAPPADDATTTPDLASLPAKPTTASTPAQQQQVAQQVTAAGSQAQYSADALRAGTEPAAPPPAGSQPVTVAAATPPGISDVPPTADNAPPSASDAPPMASNVPPTANDLPPTAGEAPSAAPSVAAAPVAPPPATSRNLAAVPAVPPRGARPVRAASNIPPAEPPAAAPEAAAPSVAPALEPPVAAASAATTVASAAPVSGAEPAVPAVAPVGSGTRMAMLAPTASPSDSALGFKPSTAPPLDPSISNWVSAPILAHYRQTASAADVDAVGNAAVPAAEGRQAMGGPNMSGAVVANMDALSSAAAGTIAANYGGVPPTAIVYFGGDGTTLNAQGRAKVREAAVAFKAAGGAGTVRVVGHAASRTANMSVEKHLEIIFEKSQKRADAVAQELIHDGVPANKVNIQAVGDSQPIYYKSMPKGEDGNRRVEIFLQG